MLPKKLTVKVGDRWSVIGAAGSGKTWFSRDLLDLLSSATEYTIPIYILDTKIAGDFNNFTAPGIGRMATGNNPPAPFDPDEKTGPFLVWQPEYDNLDMYNDFFKGIYQKRTPAIIYIDELSSITSTSGRSFPRYYDILLKQGRGLEIGIITVTQSASFIPKNVLGQSTHLVRFNLNDEYDLKKLKFKMGKKAMDEPMDDYGLWYKNCNLPIKKQPSLYFKDKSTFFGLDD